VQWFRVSCRLHSEVSSWMFARTRVSPIPCQRLKQNLFDWLDMSPKHGCNFVFECLQGRGDRHVHIKVAVCS